MSNKNYFASVVSIKDLKKHPNADRLQVAEIFGNDVIVGLDVKPGDIGLFFPLESQLGAVFAEKNNLIRYKDENGKNVGGMFDQNRRVRAQAIRGQRSMGFWIPMIALARSIDAEYDQKFMKRYGLSEGDTIEKFNGIEIAKKYIIELPEFVKNSKDSKKIKLKNLIIPGQFAFHFDTEQLGKNIDRIKPTDLISVTWKTHGTSFIAAKILCNKVSSRFRSWVLSLFGIKETVYQTIASSRTVIRCEGNDLWASTGKYFDPVLRKGETVYCELVGFMPSGIAIQSRYDYGCPIKTYKAQIYRITSTDPDGNVIELQWPQMVKRSQEIAKEIKDLCVETVPEIFYGYAKDLFDLDTEDQNWNKKFFDSLAEKYVHDQDSIFCRNKVPEEGIVVRVDHGLSCESFKLKSFKFLGIETEQLDRGIADLESSEMESVQNEEDRHSDDTRTDRNLVDTARDR